MKTTIALLAGASLLLMGVPCTLHAQAAGMAAKPFADVPAAHWASQAVDTLQKAGLIVGSPDGTYGGQRALTRYEFAAAVNRLLPLVKTRDVSDPASRKEWDALGNDFNRRQAANEKAAASLHSQINGFQPTLQRLGQDEATVDARLDALGQRLGDVRKH